MAITKTTLAGAMGANDVAASVTSATGFAAGNFLKVDDEYMLIDRSYVSGATYVPVLRRGDRASIQTPHSVLAVTTTGLVSDLAAMAPGSTTQDSNDRLGMDVVTIGANVTLTIPTRDTYYLIDKGSAAAIVLPAPGADQDGLCLVFSSISAFAHVITATALVNNGLTGSPWTTLTLAAFLGGGISVRAAAGKWQVVSNVATVLT